MVQKKFTLEEAFRFGWEKTKKHFWLLAGIVFASMAAGGLQNFFFKLDIQRYPLPVVIGVLFFWAVNLIIQMGMIRVALRLHDGIPACFSEIFSAWRMFFKYLAGSILYSLIVMGGLILLIVPGIMWAVRFQLFAYYIIDKNAGPVEALKLSSQATQGARLDIFWFDLACMGVAVLGILALVIGIFVAIPVIMMATVYVYRRLESQASASAAAVATPI